MGSESRGQSPPTLRRPIESGNFGKSWATAFFLFAGLDQTYFVISCLPMVKFVNSSFFLFVAASHQTGLDTRSKARRPIKVGIKGRGRSGTSRDSNPAGLCCSSTHLVQCEPDEANSFTNPNVGSSTYAGLWLELDTKV